MGPDCGGVDEAKDKGINKQIRRKAGRPGRIWSHELVPWIALEFEFARHVHTVPGRQTARHVHTDFRRSYGQESLRKAHLAHGRVHSVGVDMNQDIRDHLV
eukprot:COSAG01_NODE_40195_length_466_cov_3.079019_1_plen_100_part_01